MKKHLSILCLVLSLALFCLPAATAAEVPSQPLGKVYVIGETESGKTVKTAAPDAAKMDNLDRYELYVEKEPVLSVGSNAGEATGAAAIPKFYHVKFMIPDTTEEVYLTGLRAQYVEEIQQAIIDSYLGGENFDLTGLGFIDTEKTLKQDGDEGLCWAASAADILTYTGWAAKAGFRDEDEVFDVFAKEFSDNGSHQHNGLAWFFNGAMLRANLGLLGSKALNYPYSGGYLKGYAYDMVCDFEYLESVAAMNHMSDYLENGYGISLGIVISDTQNRSGGHATTLWGLVTDTALDRNDPKRFKSFFMTDSDSHFSEGDRRDAPDVLSLYHLDSSSGKFAFRYYDDVTGVFDDYTYLVPYSKNVPHETDFGTMRDKTRYPDLAVYQQYLEINGAAADANAVYESGANIGFGCSFANTADKRYRANAVLETTVTDQKGKALFSNSDSRNLTLNYTEFTDSLNYTAKQVPAGDYTLQFTINPKHTVTEAYYYNNTRTMTFKVRDSYLGGDFNGDGKVNIQDATDLQRYLAEFTNAGSKPKERGNVNGGALNIQDVTDIQRSLADIPTTAAVGEKKLHEVI